MNRENMEKIKIEGKEQAASTTPILDSILKELPPPRLLTATTVKIDVVEQAKKRLLKKIEKDKLTQTDIENELKKLPDVGGVEEGKKSLVDAVRINLHPHGDIKRLPVE